MTDRYEHLGPFSDLVTVVAAPTGGPPPPQPALDHLRVRRLLEYEPDGAPRGPRVERRWTRNGVTGEEVSWSVGYGPRTHAWLLRPSTASGPLPGVLALHSHDSSKYHGKEKIADGPAGPVPALADLRRDLYGGRAFADELARRGFVVLVPDVVMWGSRRFPAGVMAAALTPSRSTGWLAPEEPGDPGEAARYERLAAAYEHVLAKYCTALGTSLPGLAAYEDRVAAAYLAARPEVRPGDLGCVGLSGGGIRAALLRATSPRLRATVIVGAMTTYRGLLDRHVANHTWLLFPPGLAQVTDWPELAAAHAPAPLLVQYLRGDHLFSLDGMRAAHQLLTDAYAAAGAREAYRGEFYDGPHRFDVDMQDSAFASLTDWLG